MITPHHGLPIQTGNTAPLGSLGGLVTLRRGVLVSHRDGLCVICVVSGEVFQC